MVCRLPWYLSSSWIGAVPVLAAVIASFSASLEYACPFTATTVAPVLTPALNAGPFQRTSLISPPLVSVRPIDQAKLYMWREDSGRLSYCFSYALGVSV